MRILATTTENAYRLDVDQLAREVLNGQRRVVEQMARTPCTVWLHRQTRHEVMKHKPAPGMPPYWQPSPDGVKPDTFVGVALVVDDSVPLGYATLEVCEGCLSVNAQCLHDGSR